MHIVDDKGDPRCGNKFLFLNDKSSCWSNISEAECEDGSVDFPLVGYCVGGEIVSMGVGKT